MAKVIAVFGVNNPLGCSVVSALSRNTNYAVRAIIDRNEETSAMPSRCEVTKVDLNDLASVRNALTGTYGAFLVTTSDHTDDGKEEEIRQGKNLADACAREGVKHVVYCTQLSVLSTIGMHARHMDAKAEIEKYMNSLDLPLTSIIVPCCYEGLLTVWKPHPLSTNSFEFTIPMGHRPLDMMSVDDVGPVVNAVFNNCRQFLHKTLSLSADKLTIKHLAAILNRHIVPNTFRDKQLTVEQYRDLMLHMNQHNRSGEDHAHMFDFFIRVDQRCSIDMTKQLHPHALNFEQWACREKNRIADALQTPPPKLAKYWN